MNGKVLVAPASWDEYKRFPLEGGRLHIIDSETMLNICHVDSFVPAQEEAWPIEDYLANPLACYYCKGRATNE